LPPLPHHQPRAAYLDGPHQMHKIRSLSVAISLDFANVPCASAQSRPTLALPLRRPATCSSQHSRAPLCHLKHAHVILLCAACPSSIPTASRRPSRSPFDVDLFAATPPAILCPHSAGDHTFPSVAVDALATGTQLFYPECFAEISLALATITTPMDARLRPSMTPRQPRRSLRAQR